MPSFTERQRILWKLRRLLEREYLVDHPGDFSPHLFDLLLIYAYISETRYLDRLRDLEQRRHRDVYAVTARHMTQPDVDFYHTFRMTKSTFNHIHALIARDPWFQQEPSPGRPQAPSISQLSIALFRFTHNGNGSSVKEVAKMFGVTEGSVHNYTNRVILSLLRLEKDTAFWPEADERRSIAAAFEREGVPGGCVGLVDGVHIILAGKPHRPDGNDMRNRHGVFSFNVMGIVDDTKRIRFAHTGYAGRRHDSVVYKNSPFHTHPAKYLSPGEYILGDSAYPTNDHCVPLFKKEDGEPDLVPAEEAFNKQMARVRVWVEHAFGILKQRFSSLQALRLRIRTARDERRCTAWIRSCIVLHNLMRPDDDEALTYIEIEEAAVRANAALQACTGYAVREEEARGHWRRMEVMRALGLWTEQDGYLI